MNSRAMFVVVPLGVFAPSLALAQSAPTAQSVAAAVQAHYGGATDVSMDFVQSSHNALAQGSNNAPRNGRATFARGGSLRMDYASPAGDVIASDGTTLWAHDAAARQTVCSAAPSGGFAALATVFTGGGNIAASFSLSLLNAQRYHFPTGNVLELTPLQPMPGTARLLLYVDGASSQVVRLVTFDAQGNRSSFEFSHEQTNTHPAPAIFHFVNPAGSQLVRAQGYTGPC